MLKIRNLIKYYHTKNGATFNALKGISFDLPNNGFVFIVGKSGSGKSTLLNIIGGLESFDSGEIIIKGKSSTTFKASDFDSYRNTYVGFVFQEFNLLEDMTLGKNVQLALELQSYKGNMDEKVDEILNSVELLDKKFNKINEISGGQKQRVAIARALVKNPEIIIADEPTGNLDSQTGRSVMETLKKLSKEKLVIMVTHDVEYATEYADRVIELKDGLVISDNTKPSIPTQNVQYIESKETDLKKVIYIPKENQTEILLADKINMILSQNPNVDLYVSISNNNNLVSLQEPTISNTISELKNEEPVVLDYSEKTNFNMIKSKLPLWDSFKMGFKNVFLKKIKLFFTVLLMCVAFIFFGQSEAIRTISFATPAVATTLDTGIPLIEINAMYTIAGISESTFENYESSFKSNSIHKLYLNDLDAWLFKDNINLTPEKDRKDYEIFSYDIKAVQTDFKKYSNNRELIHKDDTILSKNNSIIISEYLAETLVGNNAQFDKMSDLLGKEIIAGLQIGGIFPFKMEEIKILREVKAIIDSDPNGRNYSKYSDYMKISAARSLKFTYSSIILNKNFPYSDWTMKGSLSNRTQYRTLPNAYKNYTHFVNKTPKDLAKNEIIVRYEDAINIDPNFDPNTFSSPLQSSQSAPDGSALNIVGVLYEGLNTFENENMLTFVSESDLQIFLRGHTIGTNWETFSMVAALGNNAQSRNFMNSVYNDKSLSFANQSIETLRGMMMDKGLFSKIFLGISLVTLALSIFLLFSNITTSVLSKKREIGTLRAIGARGWDVAKIFIIEALIITIFVALIAIGGVYSLSSLFSLMIGGSIGYVQLITIKWFIVVELLVIAIVAAFISSYLPVLRVTKMKPIDAIKNK